MKKPEGKRQKAEWKTAVASSAVDSDENLSPGNEFCHQSGVSWLRDVCDAVSLDWFLAL